MRFSLMFEIHIPQCPSDFDETLNSSCGYWDITFMLCSNSS